MEKYTAFIFRVQGNNQKDVLSRSDSRENVILRKIGLPAKYMLL
jgi:hypothetical protein